MPRDGACYTTAAFSGMFFGTLSVIALVILLLLLGQGSTPVTTPAAPMPVPVPTPVPIECPLECSYSNPPSCTLGSCATDTCETVSECVQVPDTATYCPDNETTLPCEAIETNETSACVSPCAYSFWSTWSSFSSCDDPGSGNGDAVCSTSRNRVRQLASVCPFTEEEAAACTSIVDTQTNGCVCPQVELESCDNLNYWSCSGWTGACNGTSAGSLQVSRTCLKREQFAPAHCPESKVEYRPCTCQTCFTALVFQNEQIYSCNYFWQLQWYGEYTLECFREYELFYTWECYMTSFALGLGIEAPFCGTFSANDTWEVCPEDLEQCPDAIPPQPPPPPLPAPPPGEPIPSPVPTPTTLAPCVYADTLGGGGPTDCTNFDPVCFGATTATLRHNRTCPLLSGDVSCAPTLTRFSACACWICTRANVTTRDEIVDCDIAVVGEAYECTQNQTRYVRNVCASNLGTNGTLCALYTEPNRIVAGCPANISDCPNALDIELPCIYGAWSSFSPVCTLEYADTPWGQLVHVRERTSSVPTCSPEYDSTPCACTLCSIVQNFDGGSAVGDCVYDGELGPCLGVNRSYTYDDRCMVAPLIPILTSPVCGSWYTLAPEARVYEFVADDCEFCGEFAPPPPAPPPPPVLPEGFCVYDSISYPNPNVSAPPDCTPAPPDTCTDMRCFSNRCFGITNCLPPTCKTSRCNNGTCVYDDVVCNDGNACTTEACNLGTGLCAFQAHPAPIIAACGNTSCDRMTGVWSTAALTCPPGQYCRAQYGDSVCRPNCTTAGDCAFLSPGVCEQALCGVDGVCSLGPITCPVDEYCDVETGVCTSNPCTLTCAGNEVFVEEECACISCVNTSLCTTASVVDNVCVQTPIVCADFDLCTTDTCVENVGCVSNPVVCAQPTANACLETKCVLGVCQDMPKNCTTKIWLERAFCVPVANATFPTAGCNNVHYCDDGNPCTNDVFQTRLIGGLFPFTGCFHDRNFSCCLDDDELCPAGTVCSNGDCIPDPNAECINGQACGGDVACKSNVPICTGGVCPIEPCSEDTTACDASHCGRLPGADELSPLQCVSFLDDAYCQANMVTLIGRTTDRAGRLYTQAKCAPTACANSVSKCQYISVPEGFYDSYFYTPPQLDCCSQHEHCIDGYICNWFTGQCIPFDPLVCTFSYQCPSGHGCYNGQCLPYQQ